MRLHAIGRILCAMFLLTISFPILAKTIDLYDQPTKEAKVIGKINTESGIVPIFKQKDGKWIKVGDPLNGNTGWIQSTEMESAIANAGGFSFSQTFTSDEKNAPVWSVKFGTPKPMTAQESAAWVKQLQLNQQTIQKEMQRMMQSWSAMDTLWMNYPFVLPVMMVPVQQEVIQKSPMPAKTTTTPK